MESGLLQTLAEAAVLSALWASVAFIFIYTAFAKWWKTDIGRARISLDAAIVLTLFPAQLLIWFPSLNATLFNYIEIFGFFVVGAVVVWNAWLVVKTQLRRWKNGGTSTYRDPRTPGGYRGG